MCAGLDLPLSLSTRMTTATSLRPTRIILLTDRIRLRDNSDSRIIPSMLSYSSYCQSRHTKKNVQVWHRLPFPQWRRPGPLRGSPPVRQLEYNLLYQIADLGVLVLVETRHGCIWCWCDFISEVLVYLCSASFELSEYNDSMMGWCP